MQTLDLINEIFEIDTVMDIEFISTHNKIIIGSSSGNLSIISIPDGNFIENIQQDNTIVFYLSFRLSFIYNLFKLNCISKIYKNFSEEKDLVFQLSQD